MNCLWSALSRVELRRSIWVDVAPLGSEAQVRQEFSLRARVAAMSPPTGWLWVNAGAPHWGQRRSGGSNLHTDGGVNSGPRVAERNDGACSNTPGRHRSAPSPLYSLPSPSSPLGPNVLAHPEAVALLGRGTREALQIYALCFVVAGSRAGAGC